jgi:hypothetical protein
VQKKIEDRRAVKNWDRVRQWDALSSHIKGSEHGLSVSNRPSATVNVPSGPTATSVNLKTVTPSARQAKSSSGHQTSLNPTKHITGPEPRHISDGKNNAKVTRISQDKTSNGRQHYVQKKPYVGLPVKSFTGQDTARPALHRSAQKLPQTTSATSSLKTPQPEHVDKTTNIRPQQIQQTTLPPHKQTETNTVDESARSPAEHEPQKFQQTLSDKSDIRHVDEKNTGGHHNINYTANSTTNFDYYREAQQLKQAMIQQLIEHGNHLAHLITCRNAIDRLSDDNVERGMHTKMAAMEHLGNEQQSMTVEVEQNQQLPENCMLHPFHLGKQQHRQYYDRLITYHRQAADLLRKQLDQWDSHEAEEAQQQAFIQDSRDTFAEVNNQMTAGPSRPYEIQS